jgi:hypothetical protein
VPQLSYVRPGDHDISFPTIAHRRRQLSTPCRHHRRLPVCVSMRPMCRQTCPCITSNSTQHALPALQPAFWDSKTGVVLRSSSSQLCSRPCAYIPSTAEEALQNSFPVDSARWSILERKMCRRLCWSGLYSLASCMVSCRLRCKFLRAHNSLTVYD